MATTLISLLLSHHEFRAILSSKLKLLNNNRRCSVTEGWKKDRADMFHKPNIHVTVVNNNHQKSRA
jgi:hypothetical protein